MSYSSSCLPTALAAAFLGPVAYTFTYFYFMDREEQAYEEFYGGEHPHFRLRGWPICYLIW